MMLGAIYVLNEIKDELCGTVKFLLQAREETCSGAIPMIEGGALDGVDFILGLHNGTINKELKDGCIGIKDGSLMACMDKFKIKVNGKGSHGAQPHMSVDLVVTSAHIIILFYRKLFQELNAVDSAIISVCMVHGGTAFLICNSDSIELTGTARAVSKEVREYIAKRIGEVAKSVAEAFRATTEYEYTFGAPPLVNDDEIVDFAKESAIRAVGKEKCTNC